MSKTKQERLRRWTLAALFAALIGAGASMSIPLPISVVPISLQNLFVVLAALLLGPLAASLATLVFLAVGALGAPVFAGMKGGLVVILAGPTGGFLIGYLLAAMVAGLIAGKPGPKELSQRRLRRYLRLALASGLGFLLIYIPGLLRLHSILNRGAFFQVIQGNWSKTLLVGLLPFLPGDAIKFAISLPIAMRLRNFLILTEDD